MDYLDHQAEVSEGEGSSDTYINDDEPKQAKKRKLKEKKDKKPKKRRQLDSSDEEDEDDEEDEAAAEEMKEFITDEEEEHNEEASEKSGKSDNEEPMGDLDEDDFDLIEENIEGQRRVVETFDSDEDLDDRSAIEKKLFDDEDDEELPSRRLEEREEALSDSEDEGSEDNFIVNELDGEKQKRRRPPKQERLNMPVGALEEAREVFGADDFDFDGFYQEHGGGEVDEDAEQIVDDEEEDDEREDDYGEPIPRTRRRKKVANEVSIIEQMEPSELERGFMTTMDKKIMLEDKPERFQLRRTPVTECDEADLTNEVKWIYVRAFKNEWVSDQEDRTAKSLRDSYDDKIKVSRVETAIKEVLRCIRLQFFEPPFIKHYRKEFHRGLLTLEEMWRIYEFDEKWCHLQERKSKVMELMRRMQTFQLESQSAKKMVSELDIHDLVKVQDEEALADVYSQFQLYHGNDIGKMMEWEKMKKGEEDGLSTKYKVGSKTDQYQFFNDNGIGEMARRFGLTARQFAENMDWKRHEVEQDPMSVDDAAAEYISSVFPTIDSVIQAASFMVAKEISRQPDVRMKVRRDFRRRATISVRPTKTGRAQLDEANPVYCKRYLKEKPVKELRHADFLYLWKLKQGGLLDISIGCDSANEIKVKNALVDLVLLEAPFRKDDYTEQGERWNKVRDDAVRKAVYDMLVPYLKTELEMKLLEEAKAYVAEQCSNEIRRRIESQGFKPHNHGHAIDEDHEFARHGAIRVMAIAYPDDHLEASFGAVVNEEGQVVDYVRLVHLTKRADRQEDYRQLKLQSMEFLKKMIERKHPHVVAIVARDMEAIRLKKDIENAIADVARDEGIEVPVVFVEYDTAKVYAGSKLSMIEFPDYPVTLRAAISAARSLVDPLIEMTALFNQDEDMMCLTMHPLQSDVDKKMLKEAISKQMVNSVCEVGCDINRCIENSHDTNMVQFIAGLGPRKAFNLIREIRQTTQVLGSRTNLVTHSKMGPKVFMNCAGFIKIDLSRISDRSEDYVEVLDSSRIHPETYEWARKMAVDALEVDDNADPQAAIEELMNAPERLKDLDLEAFADELDRQGFGEKRDTLYDINEELQNKYKDHRRQYEPMNSNELLDALTKELKEMLKPGKLVQGVVMGVQHRRLKDSEREATDRVPMREETSSGQCWVCQFCFEKKATPQEVYDHIAQEDPRKGGCAGTPVGIKVRLDCGFIGFVPSKNLSDDPRSFKHPLERVQVGRMIWCRVITVEVEKLSCFLTCKSSDLRNEDSSEKDPYWDIDAEEEDKANDALERRRQTDSVGVVKRVIQHSAFQNISYHDAQRQLSKSEQGECIIRPSSKSADRLTATWKVTDGVYANVEIQEQDKEQLFTLGKKLIIGGEEFEDLNEIIARHIQPMAGHARDIIFNKYYLDGIFAEDVGDVEKRLREERKKNPSRTPYCLTPAVKYPGKFMLSFAHPKFAKILHEYMTVTPDGIRFRQRIHASFDNLIIWFKANWNDIPTLGYR